MDEFRKIFGMCENELVVLREKSATGTVESRHDLLKRVLGNKFAKGDIIKDAIDLQIEREKKQEDQESQI